MGAPNPSRLLPGSGAPNAGTVPQFRPTSRPPPPPHHLSPDPPILLVPKVRRPHPRPTSFRQASGPPDRAHCGRSPRVSGGWRQHAWRVCRLRVRCLEFRAKFLESFTLPRPQIDTGIRAACGGRGCVRGGCWGHLHVRDGEIDPEGCVARDGYAPDGKIRAGTLPDPRHACEGGRRLLMEGCGRTDETQFKARRMERV